MNCEKCPASKICDVTCIKDSDECKANQKAFKSFTGEGKVKKMSIEELVNLIDDVGCKHCAYRQTEQCHPTLSCKEGIRKWLTSEVQDEK